MKIMKDASKDIKAIILKKIKKLILKLMKIILIKIKLKTILHN